MIEVYSGMTIIRQSERQYFSSLPCASGYRAYLVPKISA